jgi:hypothetical protein
MMYEVTVLIDFLPTLLQPFNVPHIFLRCVSANKEPTGISVALCLPQILQTGTPHLFKDNAGASRQNSTITKRAILYIQLINSRSIFGKTLGGSGSQPRCFTSP